MSHAGNQPQNIAAEKKKLSHKYSVDSISKFIFMNHFCPKSTFRIRRERDMRGLSGGLGSVFPFEWSNRMMLLSLRNKITMHHPILQIKFTENIVMEGNNELNCIIIT